MDIGMHDSQFKTVTHRSIYIEKQSIPNVIHAMKLFWYCNWHIQHDMSQRYCYLYANMQLHTYWRYKNTYQTDLVPRLEYSEIHKSAQMAKFMGPTWGPPGSYPPQMDSMLAPWTLLSQQSMLLLLLPSPAHQKPWYHHHRLNKFLSSTRKNFHYLCQSRDEIW